MHGPWYTLKDAEEILSLRRSELLHHIDTGNIRPVVTTKQRSFLVFKRDGNKRWLGLGTCNYRGCLALHPDSITNLLENKDFKLGTGSGQFIEPEKVQNWSANYPFKQQPPFSVLTAWHGSKEEAVDLSRCAVTPLPLEGQSTTALIGGLAKSAMQFMTKGDQVLSESKEMLKINEAIRLYPYEWSFDANSTFSSEDIRIAASEIEKFITPKSNIQEGLPQVTTCQLKHPPGKRSNQLHELMLRALIAHPSAKTKQIWSLIQNDSVSDEPQYDLEHIISNMDAAGIDWQSRNGKALTMKWASFEERISKLRKQLPA